MQPFAQELRTVIEKRRAELVHMLGESEARAKLDHPAYEPTDIEQMVNGFVALLVEGLEERPPEIRGFFLQTAIPGLRDSGTTMHVMVRGSVRSLIVTAIALSQHVAPEHRAAAAAWLGSFMGAFVADVADVWAAGK